MSNVNTMTDPVAHNATTGGSIVMSFAAPTHQSANVNFNCNVQGTSGATVGEFSVYQCDSFTGGTSAPLTQTKVNTTDPETPQGTWLTWAGGQPTPVNPVLLDRIFVPTLAAGITRTRQVRGGKIIYLVAKNATNATPTVCFGNCNQ